MNRTIVITNNDCFYSENSSDYILEDNIIVRLLTDEQFKRSFLETLGVSFLKISRLGEFDSKYYNPVSLKLNEIPTMYGLQEVGAFAEI